MDNPKSMTPAPRASKLDTLLGHLAKCNKISIASKTHALLLKRYRATPKSDKENRDSQRPGTVARIHTPSPAARSLFPSARHTLNGSSPTPACRLTRSFSETDMALVDMEGPAAQRARYDEAMAHVDAVDSDPHHTFPFSLSKEFQGDFTKLLVTGNVAFRAAEHPFWKHFFSKWIPGAVLPTRQAVGGRLLDGEAESVINGMKVRVFGRYGTGQSDGWKNIAKASIIGSMVNAEYEPHILHTYDTTHEAKTAENLLVIVEREIDFCEDVLGMIVAAWCTDGGGDCAKMRRLLLRKRPHLAGPHCWAHQVRLSVGDYLKVKTPAVAVLEIASEAVSWFNSHSRALSILQQAQLRKYGRILALLRPPATRWTGQYCMADRVLHFEKAIRSALVDSKEDLIASAGRERAQIEKATRMLDELEHPEFWKLLKGVRDHLEPLAIASNATQGDHARLDVVLITLANLYQTYCSPSFDDGVRATMLKSLEARWKKSGTEREIYILAIVLNPYLRCAPFRPNNPVTSTPNGLWNIFKRNYERMEQREVDTDLEKAFTEYAAGMGDWSDAAMDLHQTAKRASHTGQDVNLITLWRRFDTKDQVGANGLVKFAMRILSIVPNSGATERFFSRLGIVQNKYRNRMHPERARKVVLIKAECDRLYGTGRSEQHRKFGTTHDTDGEIEDETAAGHAGELSDEEPAEHGEPHSASTTAGESFMTLASELIASAEEDANEPPDSDGATPAGEPLMSSITSSLLPPPTDTPIRRSEALCLRNLFAFPPPGGNSPSTSTLLTKFWTRSQNNLAHELARYSEEATGVEAQAQAGTPEDVMDEDTVGF